MEKEIEYRDIEQIRQKLATREERYFTTSVYMNMYENDEEKLTEECKKLEQKMAGFLDYHKKTNHTPTQRNKYSTREDKALMCALG